MVDTFSAFCLFAIYKVFCMYCTPSLPAKLSVNNKDFKLKSDYI